MPEWIIKTIVYTKEVDTQETSTQVRQKDLDLKRLTVFCSYKNQLLSRISLRLLLRLEDSLDKEWFNK